MKKMRGNVPRRVPKITPEEMKRRREERHAALTEIEDSIAGQYKDRITQLEARVVELERERDAPSIV